MADPLKNLIGGLVSGFEAETGRQRLKDAAELGGNESALTNSGFNLGGRAKTLRPKTFTDSVFTGFRNASLTPEQRLNAERNTYLNEATQLDMALKQQEFNDMRQGSRGVAALVDRLQGVKDPTERLRMVNENPALFRLAPKPMAALQGAVEQEIKFAVDNQKRVIDADAVKRTIASESLAGRREQAKIDTLADMDANAPELAERYAATLQNGDLAERQNVVTEFKTRQATLAGKRGFRFEQNADGTLVFAQDSGLDDQPNTIGTDSKLQSQLVRLDDIQSNIDVLLSSLQTPDAPRAVGLLGAVSELKNRYAAQVFPGAFDPQAAKIRKQLKSVREVVMREISGDTRFNKDDAQRIKDIAASDEINESVPNAITATVEILRIITNRRALIERSLNEGVSSLGDAGAITLSDGTTVYKQP